MRVQSKMEGEFTFLFIVISFQYICGQSYELCANDADRYRSCSEQILGDKYAFDGACSVEYVERNAIECLKDFNTPKTKFTLGEVDLRATFGHPSIHYSLNKTIIEIIFRSIKWKRIRFRIQRFARKINYCRNIVISDKVTVYHETVLNYDCYWTTINGSFDGEVHIFDFEATDGVIFGRGLYHFFIPSQEIFSPTVSETSWKPFSYVENLEDSMVLHIMPPPDHLNISGYLIEIKMKSDDQSVCDETVEKRVIEELSYKYWWPARGGRFYFVITPIHKNCKIEDGNCLSVKSPIISVSDPLKEQMLYIWIIVVILLFVILTIFFIVYRNWSKKLPTKIPPPTKVLVVYPVKNSWHVECVESFICYLRHDCGIDVMYDGDISETSHRDPFFWAKQAIEVASQVMYIVGPSEDTQMYNHIYPNIDNFLLSLLKDTPSLQSSKNILIVFFEHSNDLVPIEVKHGKRFDLLNDWNKLKAFLSKDLLPETTIELTETGKIFIKNLSQMQDC